MDYYETLHVSKEASEVDIKKAYRRLAHKYHPDKPEGDANRFKDISEAYQVLGDATKRSNYDTFGSADLDFGDMEGFRGEDFAATFTDKREQQLVKVSALIEQIVAQAAAQNSKVINAELAKELAQRVLNIIYGE
jgi:DnaJ-class molecular chaperone